MRSPRVCVLRTAGTNCDKETAYAFSVLGAKAELVHINSILNREAFLDDFHILALPGGFTYGDDIAAGKVLANELRYKLGEDLRRFVSRGKLIIGICNGFQILVKSGLLPGHEQCPAQEEPPARTLVQEASLIINDSGSFRDEWVYLKAAKSQPESLCVWAKDLPEVIYLPIAHGEGKFVTADSGVLARLRNNRQIVLRYCDDKGELAGFPFNPNGSMDNIAGICDPTGRILGLMPHPERHFDPVQHPRWEDPGRGSDGFLILKNGVEYARKFL